MISIPREQPTTLADLEWTRRFWTKVDRRGPNECWPWLASTVNGYGRFKMPGEAAPRRAHRVVYELLVGPIPEGLAIDHLCRNRACCNPSHMEPVTLQVNILRGTSPAAQHAVKTHCPHGHAYDATNTILGRRPHGRFFRKCRTCDRARKRGESGVSR